MDVGSVKTPRDNAHRARCDLFPYLKEYRYAKSKIPRMSRAAFRRGQRRERERERERDRVFKRQSGNAKKRTRRTYLDLGGLEAGDGRDLLSSSKHDCECVCCVCE